VTGPVTEADVPAVAQGPADPGPGGIELTDSHVADVAGLSVRRALPRRARRTIGAWCFLDHMGPVEVSDDREVNVGPHPHMGLQTVTWLLSGELLHRDSLGSEQLIRPGQLNLMTAGAGVSHAEESIGTFRGQLQGVQLWVAQPGATRLGAAAFEHHGELPQVPLDRGEATVLVGAMAGTVSPARHDSDLVGLDLNLTPGPTLLPLDPAFEHGLVVLDGAIEVDQLVVEPGHLAYLGPGRDELAIAALRPTRAIVVGGRPFPEPLLMWWNFVARTRDEVTAAYQQWQNGDDRFGVVASPLARIPARPPVWLTSSTP
jgi:quercetin 2,3-dioxygenase